MESPDSIRNPVEELAEEFIRRRRNHEQVSIDEYANLYPELADEIRELFPAMAIMENVRSNVIQDVPAHQNKGSSHVGMQIGEYRIVREIGRGGMGIVYEAQQVSLGRRVALKVLATHLVRSSNYLDRFRREARAAASLQHANIVPVFGVGCEDAIHYYVMQYIHGRGMDEILQALPEENGDDREVETDECSARDLAFALKSGVYQPFTAESSPTHLPGHTSTDIHEHYGSTDPEIHLGVTRADIRVSTDRFSEPSNYVERIAKLGAHVADALSFAHERGILHRDIKPSNLLLDMFGNVWITDFGLAKIEGEEDLTETGDILGTLRYLSPESTRGKYDARSDIYGLGMTIYELLARQRAFDGKNRRELIHQIAETGPPRLSQHAPDTPTDLETVVHKAIAIEPNDRYLSAREFCDDLNRFLRHEPVLARRISPLERLARWSRRNPGLSGLLATVALLLVLGFFGSVVSAMKFKKESDEAKRRLVNANIYLAEAKAISGRPGQRTAGLNAIQESVPIAIELKMVHEMKRMRNAAIACMARADFDVKQDNEWDAASVEINSADIDPSLQHYAFFTQGGSHVKVCRIKDRKELNSFQVHNPRGTNVRLSHDGRFLSVVAERTVEIWDVSKGSSLFRHDLGNNQRGYAFGLVSVGRASDRIAVASVDGRVRVYELPGFKVLHELPKASPVSYVAFGPNDEQLVVCRDAQQDDGGKKSMAEIYHVNDMKLTVEIPLAADPLTAALGSEGHLAIADREGVTVFDLRSKQRLCAFRPRYDWSRIDFDPTGKLLATSGIDGYLTMFWDARTGVQALILDAQMIGVRGKMLAYRKHTRLGIGQIKPSDVYQGLAAVPTNRRGTCHPNNQIMVQPGAHAGLQVWDLEERRALTGVPGFRFWWARFTPDGGTLYTSVAHDVKAVRRLYRWPFRQTDAESNQWKLGPPEHIPLPQELQPHILAMDRAGRLLAFDDNRHGKVGVLFLAEDRPPLVLDAPLLMSVDVSPDGRWLATGTWHGNEARIYDLQSARLASQIAIGRTGVTFSLDSRNVLCGTGVRIELESWKKSHFARDFDLRFWPPPLFVMNGKMAVFSKQSFEASLMLFDAASYEPLGTLTSGNDLSALECRAVTPDGEKIILSSSGLQLSIWNLRAVRKQLAAINLDWNLPSFDQKFQRTISLTVDTGDLN